MVDVRRSDDGENTHHGRTGLIAGHAFCNVTFTFLRRVTKIKHIFMPFSDLSQPWTSECENEPVTDGMTRYG